MKKSDCLTVFAPIVDFLEENGIDFAFCRTLMHDGYILSDSIFNVQKTWDIICTKETYEKDSDHVYIFEGYGRIVEVEGVEDDICYFSVYGAIHAIAALYGLSMPTIIERD